MKAVYHAFAILFALAGLAGMGGAAVLLVADGFFSGILLIVMAFVVFRLSADFARTAAFLERGSG